MPSISTLEMSYLKGQKETKMEKPDFVTQEHLEFLDDLRESGVTNMFGATPYLEEEFPELNYDQSKKVLIYWMKTFSERRPPLED